jgi:magnesium transporter
MTILQPPRTKKMAESLNTPSEKAGLPPGTLVHVGKTAAMAGQVTLVKYSADRIEEHPVATLDDIICRHETGASLWVHCQGLDMVDLLAAIGQRYDIHPLVLEDILNTHQRPKFEEYEHYCFIVLKTLGCKGALTVHHEQIALLLLGNILFTFREQADGLFDSLKQRLFHGKSRMRTMGVDYLAYVIMDAVVDNYFAVSDVMEETIEVRRDQNCWIVLNGDLCHHPADQTRTGVTSGRPSLPCARFCLPSSAARDSLIQEKTLPLFPRCFDHTLRVIDTMDSYRDLINGMLDIYL